jgi:hypothetical protein
MKKSFIDHLVRKRGAKKSFEESIGDHVIGKIGDEQTFSDPELRNRI